MIDVNEYLKTIGQTVPEISVADAYQKVIHGGSVLVDIRESDEVKAGSPSQAIRISKGMLEMQIMQHVKDPSLEVLLLCASGRRSLIAAHSLQSMGFKNVISVKGGFNEWKNQALPFETPRKLEAADVEKYKRHILIPEVGEKGQMKLLDSKILVVGSGGIGSPTALYLAAAGIGTIGIIDNDVVDKSNLQRQILFSEHQVGDSKVDSAKERLLQLNSSLKIRTYNERLTRDNIEDIITQYDIVIDGTDNFTTRYLINDACVKFGIPNIHGSVFLFEGQFTTFWPESGKEDAPCYRCLFPSPPPPELAPSCAEAGVLGVLPGMVGILCATEAIKIILKVGENQIGKLLVYDSLKMDFNTYDIHKRADCAYCNCKDKAAYPEYIDYSEYCSV
jgi:sulfur-carrier protein adenylyltransferase/sulfurtransferase